MNAERRHYDTLTVEQKQQAIRTLAAEGLSDYALSHATGLAVEQVRAVLGQPRRETA